MEFSVADAIKTASKAITGLQLTFCQIKERAELNNTKTCSTDELNRLSDIEKRLEKVEESNKRNACQLKATIKMVEILSQKFQRLSATIVIPEDKSRKTMGDSQLSEMIQKKNTDDKTMGLTRPSDEPKQKRVHYFKHKNTSKLNESKSDEKFDVNNQNTEKRTEQVTSVHKQASQEKNNIPVVPTEKKTTTSEIKQTQKKTRSKSGYKLCLTSVNEDNRLSYHQKKKCFEGELLRPVVQKDSELNFQQPNIVVKEDMYRLSTKQEPEATGKQKGIMTMAQMTERDFDQKKTVHSMDDWVNLARKSQLDVALKIACRTDNISGRGHHYIILMDISESMKGEKFDLMKKAAIEYINGLHTISLRYSIRDNIGLACFGEETKLILHPIADYDQIKEEIGKLKPGGPSPLAAGLLMALSGLTHCSPKTIGNHDFHPGIIVMTDGVPTRVEALTEDENTGHLYLSSLMTLARDSELKSALDNISRNGIKIYCVPFGSANTDVMSMLVTRTCGKCVPHNQILRMSRMTLTYLDASEIAHKMETMSDFNKGMVKTAVLSAGLQEHDRCDDITDNVMFLLDPRAQYHGLFKQPRWKAIPLGIRVRRGPNWHWKNQDSNMAGTVIGEDDSGMIWVQWDSGHKNTYTYNENTRIFDIKVVDEPRRLVDDLIAVGCKVKRGKDWRFDDQDGGIGSRGTVLRVEQNGKIVVQWDSGRLGIYKFAADDVFEVEVCEHGRTLNSPDIILPPQQEIEPSLPTQTSTAATILPAHKRKSVKSKWQYENMSGQWSSYDEETNAKIERAFNRNSKGMCIVEINNVIYIVKFTSMTQENQTDKTVVPVQRLEEKTEGDGEH